MKIMAKITLYIIAVSLLTLIVLDDSGEVVGKSSDVHNNIERRIKFHAPVDIRQEVYISRPVYTETVYLTTRR